MWPFPKRSPELEELNQIAKQDFLRTFSWSTLLLNLIPAFVIVFGVKQLEAHGVATITGWAWLIGSAAALAATTLHWRREHARMDEVKARIHREASTTAYNTLLFLLVVMAILDATFKFPSRLDGDSPWYLMAFAALLTYGYGHFQAWRRYFPSK